MKYYINKVKITSKEKTKLKKIDPYYRYYRFVYQNIHSSAVVAKKGDREREREQIFTPPTRVNIISGPWISFLLLSLYVYIIISKSFFYRSNH